MIYSAEAQVQLRELQRHYERLGRIEAIHNLAAAMLESERRIESGRDEGLVAPRPYPSLARSGQAWIKAGRYWVAYSLTVPPVIVAVFFETANIPARLRSDRSR